VEAAGILAAFGGGVVEAVDVLVSAPVVAEKDFYPLTVVVGFVVAVGDQHLAADHLVEVEVVVQAFALVAVVWLASSVVAAVNPLAVLRSCRWFLGHLDAVVLAAAADWMGQLVEERVAVGMNLMSVAAFHSQLGDSPVVAADTGWTEKLVGSVVGPVVALLVAVGC